jgi:hypothetical protein
MPYNGSWITKLPSDASAHATPDLYNKFSNIRKRTNPVNIQDIPFGVTDWSTIPKTVHPGETGTAYWQTCQFGSIRVRMVEYTPNYLADHWCVKGHILLCIEGELQTELQDGRVCTLRPGMSYQVSDQGEPHRSKTFTGARLFIVD